MNTRILVSVLAIGITAVSGSALADNGRHKGHDRDRHRDDDYARVVRVEPMIERVRYTVPVEQCWVEDRARPGRSGDAGAALIGGAIGAIFGNAIGDGRTAATLGGAVVGAAVGSELSKSDSRRDRRPRYEQVERCRTHHEERFEERVAGYRVTYEYHGRRQVTRLPYDPGRYLRVAVDVHPLG